MHRGRIAAQAALLAISFARTAAPQVTFRATVPVVIAPATVSDARGKYIDGLTAPDFELLDDGKPRKFELDTSDTVLTPLSVVIAVQANNTAPAAVQRIRKIGSMLEPLITGERGCAAVIAYDEEVRVVEDFTNDAGKLTQAMRAIRTGHTATAREIDALNEAARMLAARPAGERRAIIVIGESRDRGSKGKLDELLAAIQTRGIAVYPVVFSAYSTPWLTKPSDLPMAEGGGLIAIFTELARLGKTNAAQALAEYSGGLRVSFTTQRRLERVMTELGEELHSQYIFSYANPVCTPGFHRIEIRVRSRPEAVIRARYGYWTEADACADSTTVTPPAR
jgi:VWFA-related protein